MGPFKILWSDMTGSSQSAANIKFKKASTRRRKDAFIIVTSAFVCVFAACFVHSLFKAKLPEPQSVVLTPETSQLSTIKNSNTLELGCGEHIRSIGVTDSGDPYVVYSHSPNTRRLRPEPQDTVYEIYSPNPDLTLTIRRCFPE